MTPPNEMAASIRGDNVRLRTNRGVPGGSEIREVCAPGEDSLHAYSARKPQPVPPPAARLRLILPDPTAIGVGLTHGSLGAEAMFGPGGRLSNAWLTYPREGDNPGKLGLIPHRRGRLEWSRTETGAATCPPHTARGWGCVLSGSWRGNGPPSR